MPTMEQIADAAAQWQKVLRLRDWEIVLSVKRERDMVLKDSAGTCKWLVAKKFASIELMDETDHYDRLLAFDPERTLVHELLHLHFAPFDTDPDKDDTPIEQAIHALACALTDLRRFLPCTKPPTTE